MSDESERHAWIADVVVGVCDGDREPQRADDLARRRSNARGADNRRDPDHDLLDVLGLDTDVTGDPKVHQVRGRGSVDGYERRETYEHQRLGIERRPLDRRRRHFGEEVEDRPVGLLCTHWRLLRRGYRCTTRCTTPCYKGAHRRRRPLWVISYGGTAGLPQ